MRTPRRRLRCTAGEQQRGKERRGENCAHDASWAQPSCSMLLAASWRRQQWRPERLVGVGQCGRALDHDEAVGGGLMARVAASGELVEGACEAGAITRRDGRAEL